MRADIKKNVFHLCWAPEKQTPDKVSVNQGNDKNGCEEAMSVRVLNHYQYKKCCILGYFMYTANMIGHIIV